MTILPVQREHYAAIKKELPATSVPELFPVIMMGKKLSGAGQDPGMF